MTKYKKNSIVAFAAVALLSVSILPTNAATKPATSKPIVSSAPRGGAGTGTVGHGNGKGGGTAPGAIGPKVGSSAAYFTCLRAHGLPVTTPAQVVALDNRNTKVIAAKIDCAGR